MESRPYEYDDHYEMTEFRFTRRYNGRFWLWNLDKYCHPNTKLTVIKFGINEF